MPNVTPDISVSRSGSIVLFRPETTDSEQWIEENVTGEQSWFSGALAVEFRYAEPLTIGMIEAGLYVEIDGREAYLSDDNGTVCLRSE